MDPAYHGRIESARREKDRWMKSDLHPPLPEAQRPAFRGLVYFPVDPAYRVTARVETLPAGDEMRVPATGGEERVYTRLCKLHFALAGLPCALTGFEPEPGQSPEPYLFVPFKDKTAGKETYGGGRYLDPDPPSGPELELDFNAAYNPYCAYDDTWSCVIPPPENWLGVEVRAGEKLPPWH